MSLPVTIIVPVAKLPLTSMSSLAPENTDRPGTAFGCVVKDAGRLDTGVGPNTNWRPGLVRLSKAIPTRPNAEFPLMSYLLSFIHSTLFESLLASFVLWQVSLPLEAFHDPHRRCSGRRLLCLADTSPHVPVDPHGHRHLLFFHPSLFLSKDLLATIAHTPS